MYTTDEAKRLMFNTGFFYLIFVKKLLCILTLYLFYFLIYLLLFSMIFYTLLIIYIQYSILMLRSPQ